MFKYQSKSHIRCPPVSLFLKLILLYPRIDISPESSFLGLSSPLMHWGPLTWSHKALFRKWPQKAWVLGAKDTPVSVSGGPAFVPLCPRAIPFAWFLPSGSSPRHMCAQWRPCRAQWWLQSSVPAGLTPALPSATHSVDCPFFPDSLNSGQGEQQSYPWFVPPFC